MVTPRWIEFDIDLDAFWRYCVENNFKSYEEITKEILGRYSVADLVEQSAADLVRGDEMFQKAKGVVYVIDEGKAGLISFWKLVVDGRPYECRRFKNFAWCSCRDFFYRKKMCRHLAVTCQTPCANCGESSAKVDKLCYACHTNSRAVFKSNLKEKNNEQSSVTNNG